MAKKKHGVSDAWFDRVTGGAYGGDARSEKSRARIEHTEERSLQKSKKRRNTKGAMKRARQRQMILDAIEDGGYETLRTEDSGRAYSRESARLDFILRKETADKKRKSKAVGRRQVRSVSSIPETPRGHITVPRSALRRAALRARAQYGAVQVGPRGGRYRLVNGRKVYVR